MNKSKRINFYLFKSKGGPTIWGINLANALRKKDYQVTIYSNIFNYIKEPFSYPTIIHSTLPFPYPFRGKYILTIHGDFRREKHLLSRLYPWAIKKADFVTVPSLFLKKALNLKKALVIPNGIVQPRNKKSSYQLNKNKPVIGIMTSFHFRNKSDGMIVLAKVIKKVIPSAKLLIAGEGSLLNYCIQKVQEIGIDAKFLGYCEKDSFFDKLDIFAYYSFFDNQPMSLLEAMAYGLPVLSNNVGDVPNMMNGPLKKYVAENQNHYEEILSRLIKSEIERKNDAKLANKRAKDFAWDNIIGDWIKLYES